MRRLFTFGCSFTQYWRWPTWADILGREHDKFENWGICGGGNSQILYNLMECRHRHGISDQDTIAIMWTNFSREDRYVKDRWLEGGNVYWGSELGKDYVERYACERGYLLRDMAVIAAVNEVLASWPCKTYMMSMIPLDKSTSQVKLGEDPTGEKSLQDIYQLYQPILETMPASVFEIIFNSDWFSGAGIPDTFDPQRRDFHPTPREHLAYLDHVWPDAGISFETRAWIDRVQTQLLCNQELEWKPHLPNRL